MRLLRYLVAFTLCQFTVIAHAATERFEFLVTLDGKKLGQHNFTIDSVAPGQERVVSTAQYRYRVLFVDLYRYQHQATEQWTNGCLVGLESTTTEDGATTEVSSTLNGAALSVKTKGPDATTQTVTEPCPGSYAYWSLDRLRRSKLINSQTGRVQSVALEPLGQDSWAAVPALKYRLITEDAEILLWYANADSRWIGLQSEIEGRTLAYRPRG